MRLIVRRLLKKYMYPPAGLEDTVKIVIAKYEMWRGNCLGCYLKRDITITMKLYPVNVMATKNWIAHNLWKMERAKITCTKS